MLIIFAVFVAPCDFDASSRLGKIHVWRENAIKKKKEKEKRWRTYFHLKDERNWPQRILRRSPGLWLWVRGRGGGHRRESAGRGRGGGALSRAAHHGTTAAAGAAHTGYCCNRRGQERGRMNTEAPSISFQKSLRSVSVVCLPCSFNSYHWGLEMRENKQWPAY